MIRKLEEGIYPSDIKKMDIRQLELLSYEIRDMLISTVSDTGGHLASNLGVVELTIALHKVFDAPRDRIVWDVGHQSYVHKLLTGRGASFKSLRQLGGMSGFPKRCESVLIRLIRVMPAIPFRRRWHWPQPEILKKDDYAVVAVIGDGS